MSYATRPIINSYIQSMGNSVSFPPVISEEEIKRAAEEWKAKNELSNPGETWKRGVTGRIAELEKQVTDLTETVNKLTIMLQTASGDRRRGAGYWEEA